MKKQLDLTGQLFGQLTVIKQIEPRMYSSGQKQTTWLCECSCGKTTETTTTLLRSKRTKSCGCYALRIRTKHKDLDSKEYNAWRNMKRRCLNPNTPNYNRYGGRKITICDEWINSYEQFLSDVGRAPNPKDSLDRIDNDGNYEPSNVRWTSNTIQSINQGTSSKNTSGCKGVSWHKLAKKWRAYIQIHGEVIELGFFTDFNEAMCARKRGEEMHHKPLLLEE